MTDAERFQLEGVSRDRDRLRAQLEGWREIANALLAVAFGNPIGSVDDRRAGRGPWADNPPLELVEAVKDRAGGEALEAIRAAMLGRRWKARGSAGAGTCDYPLCRHRKNEQATVGRLDLPNGAGWLIAHDGADGIAIGERLECWRWAEWVGARILAGSIVVQP